MTEDSIIYIGSKPVMNYVLATVTRFNEGVDKVAIKARGRAISRAVDTSEVVRNRFMPDIRVEDIKISTEEITGEDGKNFNVSSIEILLKREPSHAP